MLVYTRCLLKNRVVAFKQLKIAQTDTRPTSLLHVITMVTIRLREKRYKQQKQLGRVAFTIT
jgi:hypothetical protein